MVKAAGRRRGPRVPVALDVRWLEAPDPKAEIVDLSSLGCLLKTIVRPLADQAMEFELPLDGSLRLKGRVREIARDGTRTDEGFLVGLEFVDLLPADRRRLERFVRQQSNRDVRP